MSIRSEYLPEDEFADQFVQERDTAEPCREALLDLTGITSHKRFDEVERERWDLGMQMSQKLAVVTDRDWDFEQAGYLLKVATDLRECHSTRTVARCNGCAKVVKFWNRCDLFWCPQCSPRLSKMRLDSLMWWVDSLKQPKHLVLTLKNVPHLTADYVKTAKKSLAKFRRTKIFKGVRGGLWAMEITNKGKGWHLHFHLVIDAPWMDVRVISETWKKVNGGAGEVVWIEDANKGGLRANLPRYVTKYTGKGFRLHEWDADQLQEFAVAMRGGRTFGVFGSLLGQRTLWRTWLEDTRASRRKCECGCSEKSYYSELEFLWRTEGPPGFRPDKPAPPVREPNQFRWRV